MRITMDGLEIILAIGVSTPPAMNFTEEMPMVMKNHLIATIVVRQRITIRVANQVTTIAVFNNQVMLDSVRMAGQDRSSHKRLNKKSSRNSSSKTRKKQTKTRNRSDFGNRNQI